MQLRNTKQRAANYPGFKSAGGRIAANAPFRAPSKSGGSYGKALQSYGKSMGAGGRGLGPELKCVDVNAVTVAFNSTPAYTLTNVPVQGSTFYNRIGRKINMKSLELHLNLSPLRTVTSGDYVRCIVLYDRQPNGANPAGLATVITSYNTTGASSSTVYDFLNQTNRDRFIVLMDQRITLPSVTVSTGGSPGVITNVGVYDPEPGQSTLNIKRYIRLKGLESQFNQINAGNVGDITTGALHVMTFGAYPAGSEGYEGELTTRLRYYD